MTIEFPSSSIINVEPTKLARELEIKMNVVKRQDIFIVTLSGLKRN